MTPAPAGPLLKVEGLTVSYAGIGALFDVSFELAAGASMALLGANGAGKSTLAAVVAGVVRPDSGRVLFDGADVTSGPSHRRARTGVAYVPEGRAVFPGLSVLDNLQVSLRRTVDRKSVV